MIASTARYRLRPPGIYMDLPPPDAMVGSCKIASAELRPKLLPTASIWARPAYAAAPRKTRDASQAKIRDASQACEISRRKLEKEE
jgi:hypothetical protein